jgi:hypothetical protein
LIPLQHFGPQWSSCSSSNIIGTFWPRGPCNCCSLCPEYCSLRSPRAGSPNVVRSYSKVTSLTTYSRLPAPTGYNIHLLVFPTLTSVSWHANTWAGTSESEGSL